MAATALVDAAGTSHVAAAPGARIVCLVPSITELLLELGLAAGEGDGPEPRLVGRTGFCIHPRERVRAVAKVGGTKDVKLDAVRALAPSHVVVNVEENTRETAEALAAFVPHLVVTHPLAPRDNLALYRLLGGIFGRAAEAELLCAAFAEAAAALAGEVVARPPRRVLYLIWRDPWMAVAPDTYIARMLGLAGLLTVPEESEAAALAAAAAASPDAARYPVVELAAFAGRVDEVLLSSEPYRFRAKHLAEVEALVPGARVRLIDGELTSWYGSRAVAGLRYLADFSTS